MQGWREIFFVFSFPFVPLVPAIAKLYVNCLFTVIPPQVTGIVTTPFFVLSDVVTVNFMLAEVVPLLDIAAVIPVGNPLIEPIEHAVCVVPL